MYMLSFILGHEPFNSKLFVLDLTRSYIIYVRAVECKQQNRFYKIVLYWMKHTHDMQKQLKEVKYKPMKEKPSWRNFRNNFFNSDESISVTKYSQEL